MGQGPRPNAGNRSRARQSVVKDNRMPHIIIEHSRTGTTAQGLAVLCKSMYDVFAAHDQIPRPETLKIRTVAADHHYFASGHSTYAHATIWLLPGRDAQAKTQLSELACSVMHDTLPDVAHFSADCQDLSAGYSKQIGRAHV